MINKPRGKESESQINTRLNFDINLEGFSSCLEHLFSVGGVSERIQGTEEDKVREYIGNVPFFLGNISYENIDIREFSEALKSFKSIIKLINIHPEQFKKINDLNEKIWDIYQNIEKELEKIKKIEEIEVKIINYRGYMNSNSVFELDEIKGIEDIYTFVEKNNLHKVIDLKSFNYYFLNNVIIGYIVEEFKKIEDENKLKEWKEFIWKLTFSNDFCNYKIEGLGFSNKDLLKLILIVSGLDNTDIKEDKKNKLKKVVAEFQQKTKKPYEKKYIGNIVILLSEAKQIITEKKIRSQAEKADENIEKNKLFERIIDISTVLGTEENIKIEERDIDIKLIKIIDKFLEEENFKIFKEKIHGKNDEILWNLINETKYLFELIIQIENNKTNRKNKSLLDKLDEINIIFSLSIAGSESVKGEIYKQKKELLYGLIFIVFQSLNHQLISGEEVIIDGNITKELTLVAENLTRKIKGINILQDESAYENLKKTLENIQRQIQEVKDNRTMITDSDEDSMIDSISELSIQITKTIRQFNKINKINKEINKHINYIQDKINKHINYIQDKIKENPDSPSFEIERIREIISIYGKINTEHIPEIVDVFLLEKSLGDKNSKTLNIEKLNHYFLIEVISKYATNYIISNPENELTKKLKSIINGLSMNKKIFKNFKIKSLGLGNENILKLIFKKIGLSEETGLTKKDISYIKFVKSQRFQNNQPNLNFKIYEDYTKIIDKLATDI